MDERHISIGFLPVVLLGINQAHEIIDAVPSVDVQSKTSRKNVT